MNKALRRKQGSKRQRALKVYVRKSQVKDTSYKSWGGEKVERFEVVPPKKGPVTVTQLKGRPVDPRELKGRTLFHVTTDLSGVRQSGHLEARRSGGGLGGGMHEAVSFTTNRRTAMEIARELHRTKLLSHVTNFNALLRRFVAEDKRRAGVDRVKLARAVKATRDDYRFRRQVEGKYGPASNNMDAYRLYRMMRESAGGAPDPVMFSDSKAHHIRKVGIVAIQAEHLPKRAAFNLGADKHNQEYEVHGDVSMKKAKTLDWRDVRKRAWETRRKLYGPSGRRRK